jgi:hypothetical protein
VTRTSPPAAASATSTVPAASYAARGATTEASDAAFAPLLALHADLTRRLDDLPRHPCPQRDGALDELDRVAHQYHDVTERVLYPLAERKLSGRSLANGEEAIDLAATDRRVAERLLAEIAGDPTSDHEDDLAQLAERLRQEVALDTQVVVPELGARLGDGELEDLGAALEEARRTVPSSA